MTGDGGRAPGPLAGLRLAVGWLTVLPVRVGTDPDGGLPPGVPAAALRWAPVVGIGLGLAGGALLLALTALGTSPLVAGLLVVGAGALATRGMHLDGVADTADGLGSYGPPERALRIMAEGGAGPFAVVTLVVVLGGQAAALAQLSSAPPAAVLVTCALAAAVGRAGFCWVARRGTPAARPGGLGATVAGSQPAWVAPLWWTVLTGLGATALVAAVDPAGGARRYADYLPGDAAELPGVLTGPGIVLVTVGAVLAAALLVAGLARHTRRRFGGMSGDVLGAAETLAATTVLVVLAAAL
ncbi:MULTISPECIES: adenosylcobinamide-GDP ribazoletransferase [Pseudonocardia]|uniref:Adenosylcobinamide-GDP ribazoletransferase n=2 Tax=Pseudonocardia TaxID=1847 RepID=A0A1Y2MQC1_PSEAH|nr:MULTISPECIES: adenosylcobinamide-GDP ribazoletransferase [Pseudonocardia]OSY37434.1 Cobalamin synthase [Pseudonocardia autotrophica]TDN77241.1 cobalamin-5'-phosphate synthase [Pseudonocardia autotrophica]BBG01260.1 adenosylcobinamide-GDP ribazoletransferase [Pseudonocardia autotrophica]GEC25987.1 adenosylcobinamide-GDP ribazoletransferase [Pseudonocardia saturnea]